MEQASGPLSLEIHGAIKRALDPLNIMNPGKVLPGKVKRECGILSW